MTATDVRIIKESYVFPFSNPGQLRAVFGQPLVKEAQINGDHYCAVPYSLDAARILTNIGLKVPSPIRTEYSWPGRYKPRWYQKDTAEFLTLNPRAHCHNAPRVGKTLSALWAADYLRRIGQIKRTLIIAPLSTLWDVWEQNIFESFPFRTFAVLHGTNEYRKRLLAQPCDFYVTNHHGVALLEKELAKREDITHVIIDEVSKFKNSRAKTLYKPLNRVLNGQGIARTVWGLTGTPVPNLPTDAYAQAKLITPQSYHGSFTSFKAETMWNVGQFKWVPKKTADQTVARVLRPSIRFERSVCTDMEPCYIERRAMLSDEQKKAYNELLRQAKTDLGTGTVTAVNAAALLTKIAQVSCGVVIGADGNLIRCDFGPRLQVLEELIEENTEKVLVFVPFTGVVDALAFALRKRWSVATVDGRVSASKRNTIFQEFRAAKDPHIILSHPEVMAHGLDLTAASLSIWYAPFTKAEIYQQANARTDGSRQTAKIDIAHIYATKEEQRTYAAIKEKGKLQDVVLQMLKNGGM